MTDSRRLAKVGHVAFDEDLLAALANVPDSDPSDPVAMRESLASGLRRFNSGVLPTHPHVTFADRSIPGPPGAPDVTVRIYRPHASAGPPPAFVYFHGGGFVAGSIDGGHTRGLMVAAGVGCVVVSVDYRLAPEHRFPAGVEDCYAAVCWVADHADELGIDGDRVAVGGESAGAALAAAVSLLARDREGPGIAFQLLLYPVIDDRMATDSMRTGAAAPIWDSDKCEISWRHYLGEQFGTSDVSLYAAPGRAADLSRLPPAYISVCQGDPLRDEGIEYAQGLLRAGVAVELHLFPRTFHGFDMVGMTTWIGQRALTEQIEVLRRELQFDP